MQLSINNSTVGNIHAVGNSSNGIFCSGCTNSSFEDIITHSNTGNGFNGGEGCYPSFVNSTVSQLRSFNNGGAGVYLGRVCAG